MLSLTGKYTDSPPPHMQGRVKYIPSDRHAIAMYACYVLCMIPEENFFNKQTVKYYVGIYFTFVYFLFGFQENQ